MSRTYDILFLPTDKQFSSVQNKRTTGIQKAVQRYANLLLTALSSVEFRQEVGSILVAYVNSGAASSESLLRHVFAVANADTLAVLREDATRLGVTRDADENITTVEIEQIATDTANRMLTLTLRVTTEAGSSVTFVTPVS